MMREPDPASEAWMLIGSFFRQVAKPRFVEIAGRHGLAPQQAAAVRLLAEPMAMGDLAEALHCDNSNVTGIVDRLEERGLVRRVPGEGDRRVKMLVLTGEGERVCRSIRAGFKEPPPELASLSREDQTALRDLLRRALDDGEATRPPAGRSARSAAGARRGRRPGPERGLPARRRSSGL